MSKYQICVYTICKNEEKFVDRWMDSMGEADRIVVTDTGSEDKTVQKLRDRGAAVYEDSVRPFRFDTARNLSLAHVPDNIDICVCTDLDEVFHAGWREALEAAWRPDTKMGNYLYNWSLKSDGTPGMQIVYFKVHAKDAYQWINPVHECLEYIGQGPENKVFIPGMTLDHFPDPAKSRSSYRPLLETAVAEKPNEARMVYYLGREYLYERRWDECILTLQRYLALPQGTWTEERAAAMRWIAQSYLEKNDPGRSYQWYHAAIAETPDMRDPYVEFAKAAYLREDWPTAFYMADRALAIHEKSARFVNMEYAWDYTPDDIAAIACYRLGMYERGREHAEKALAFEPGNERLRENLRFFEEKLNG